VFDIRIGLVRDAVDRFPNSGFCMAARSPIIAGSSPALRGLSQDFTTSATPTLSTVSGESRHS
jgi:hypothetical protein